MLKLQLWFVRVVLEHLAIVKDVLVDNIDGHSIHFCDEAARIAKPDMKDKHRLVVGMPVVSIKIGDNCYHGLCDVGSSASAIPHSLYEEIMHDIAPAELEDIDVTIKLANRILLSHLGKLNILLIFLFLVPHKIAFVPLYLVDPS